MANNKAGFVEWLKIEIRSWKQRGWITKKHGLRILTYYGVDVELDDTREPYYIRPWFILLGCVALGLGFVASSGGGAPVLSKSLMLTLTIVGLVVVYGLGYYLNYINKFNTLFAELTLAAGFLIFGFSLWSLNAAYNISSESSTIFLLWSIGIIPLAIIFSWQIPLALTVLGFTAWTVSFGAHFHSPNYYFLPVIFIVLFPLIYLRKSVIGLILGIVSLSLWLGVALNAYSSSLQIFMPFFFVLWGIFLWGLSEYHKKLPAYQLFEIPYKVFAIIVSFLSLSFLALHALGITQARFLLKNEGWLFQTGLPILIFSAILAIAIIVVFLMARFKSPRGLSLSTLELQIFDLMGVAVFLYFFFPEAIPAALKGALLSRHFLIYPLIFNIILFLFIGWIIYRGYRNKIAWLLNAGLLMAAISIVARYFDNFLPMLPKTWFLWLGGAILLVIGYFMKSEEK